MNTPATFQFSGRDSMPQFAVCMLVAGLGGIPILPMLFDGFGVWAAVAYVSAGVVVAAGLRFSITVSSESVVITRRWFFIPYRTHKGRAIEDVFFGGDWGDADDAIGVVVKVDGREFHIGTSNSMRDLHAALLSFRTQEA